MPDNKGAFYDSRVYITLKLAKKPSIECQMSHDNKKIIYT